MRLRLTPNDKSLLLIIGSPFAVIAIGALCVALAPYLPYPEQYCATHPRNHACIAYKPH